MSALAVTDAEVEAFIAAHVKRGEIDAADGVHDSFAQVRAGLEAAAELRKGEWLSIDSAPRDGTRFLALTDSGYPIILSWLSEMKMFANNNWKEYTNATHWQPLPPAPAPAGADEGVV